MDEDDLRAMLAEASRLLRLADQQSDHNNECPALSVAAQRWKFDAQLLGFLCAPAAVRDGEEAR